MASSNKNGSGINADRNLDERDASTGAADGARVADGVAGGAVVGRGQSGEGSTGRWVCVIAECVEPAFFPADDCLTGAVVRMCERHARAAPVLVRDAPCACGETHGRLS